MTNDNVIQLLQASAADDFRKSECKNASLLYRYCLNDSFPLWIVLEVAKNTALGKLVERVAACVYHPSQDDLLAYFDGSADADTKADVAHHLNVDHCPTCS